MHIEENSPSNDDYSNKEIFLKKIGIKHSFIWKFFKNGITDNELIKFNLLQTLRKYFSYFDKGMRDTWTDEEEIENYRKIGFTAKSSRFYVNMLKNIYTKDTTINWIYRIAKSNICTSYKTEFENFLKKFEEKPEKTEFELSGIKLKCDQCLKKDLDCMKCGQCAMVCCKRCISLNDDNCYVCEWFNNIS